MKSKQKNMTLTVAQKGRLLERTNRIQDQVSKAKSKINDLEELLADISGECSSLAFEIEEDDYAE